MIVSVYGIPRSGKDYFIKQVTDRCNSIHIKGSESLNRISNNKYGLSFKELDANRQNEIRVEFTKEVRNMASDYEMVLVDGHFAFPVNGEYRIVFTDADLELYDAFFYLKRTPDEISRNYESGDKKSYPEYLLNPEKVEEWISFEIDGMKEIIENNDKDFIVLDSDPESIEFVSSFKRTSKDIASSIVKEIGITDKQRIVLCDLDKTISIHDLTDDYISFAGLDAKFPKRVFKGDYYSLYQFYRFHEYLNAAELRERAIEYALSRIELNERLLTDLKKLEEEAEVIAITTGMTQAWSILNKKRPMFTDVFGYSNSEGTIVTPLVKKLVAKYLTGRFEVMAIGDSIIDLGMLLESDKGYLISMLKLDKRIINYFQKNMPAKEVLQIDYSNFKYDFLKEEPISWLM